MTNKEFLQLKQKELNNWVDRNFTKEALSDPTIWSKIIMPHILEELGINKEERSKLSEDERVSLFLFELKRHNTMKGYI